MFYRRLLFRRADAWTNFLNALINILKIGLEKLFRLNLIFPPRHCLDRFLEQWLLLIRDVNEQAVHDGVDILSLSVGPNSPPTTTKTTFLNPFDATLLGAVKAGVFVAQAAGNGGPFPKTLVSYSPWIMTVAAAIDDRRYKNHLTLGNGKMLAGMGLSRKKKAKCYFTFQVICFD